MGMTNQQRIRANVNAVHDQVNAASNLADYRTKAIRQSLDQISQMADVWDREQINGRELDEQTLGEALTVKESLMQAGLTARIFHMRAGRPDDAPPVIAEYRVQLAVLGGASISGSSEALVKLIRAMAPNWRAMEDPPKKAMASKVIEQAIKEEATYVEARDISPG